MIARLHEELALYEAAKKFMKAIPHSSESCDREL
jgi:hypothetical protein